jgi:hypothetical protein
MNCDSTAYYRAPMIDDPRNNDIFKLTNKKIKDMIKHVLNITLNNYPQELKAEFHTRLKGYRYVEDISVLREGTFIKWFHGKQDVIIQPKLNNGGIIVGVNIGENGTFILCKNFNGTFYSVNMADCFVFQKITRDEQLILQTIDLIER